MAEHPWPAAAAATGFVATVIAANWAVATFGDVPVGFGLTAPAGVYAAGVAFTLRDLLHEWGGRWAVLAAIATGAAASAVVAPPTLVAASAVAFAASELADMAVYTPMRRRRWWAAVAASNTVGLAVDSALFLWIAFGTWALLPGQVVGKAWMTLAAVALLAVVRWPRRVTAS